MNSFLSYFRGLFDIEAFKTCDFPPDGRSQDRTHPVVTPVSPNTVVRTDPRDSCALALA